MVRTALWLLTEVGAGNCFTKEQHRSAFAGVAQADRRLRDLRDYGWVIHTNLEDASLKPSEQRFVSAGLPVWEPGVRRQREQQGLSAKERMTILAANNYQCAVCGIAGGEAYPDAPEARAVLSLARVGFVSTERMGETFLPYCKRCRAGGGQLSVDMERVLADVRALAPIDQDVLRSWAEQGRGGELERLWSTFRRLSAADQAKIRDLLRKT